MKRRCAICLGEVKKIGNGGQWFHADWPSDHDTTPVPLEYHADGFNIVGRTRPNGAMGKTLKDRKDEHDRRRRTHR